MAVSRVQTSSILQGFPKSRSLLAGNTAFMPSSYQSIQTVTVGSGGASSVTFSSIPSTYNHLQIRVLSLGTTVTDGVLMEFNGDTASNYYTHYLRGNGSAASATSNASTQYPIWTVGASASPTASVIDILDYANTNKYKTTRSLTGYDANGTGNIYLISGLWQSTAAISSIKLTCSLSQYSTFALYGIKG